MATELVVVHHCDVCLANDTRTPAVFTVTMATEGAEPLQVEACEDHARPLQAAWAVVGRYGVTPEGNTPARTSKARREAPTARERYACPRCSRDYHSRGALRSHLRNVHHVVNPREVSNLLPPPRNGNVQHVNPCPAPGCTYEAGSKVGLLAHARNAHKDLYSQIREGLKLRPPQATVGVM